MAAFVLAFVFRAATAGASPADTARELRARAADFEYNLDHEQAIGLLRQAVAIDPQESVNHRELASSIWLLILFERGSVTVDTYLGGFTRARLDLGSPPPDLDADFKREVSRAIALAEQEVAAAPKDASAHDDLGRAVGLQASYTASVEGRLLAGFKAARRSYDEEEHVLELDPSRKDACLIVGTYRYIVSTLSLPMRMLAYVAGFGGGKERGLHLIEESADPSSENRTDAEFALVLIYNREHRYDDALRVLHDLERRYPRNRLALLEDGSTALRAHRPGDADAVLSEGIARLATDTRPRIPGEDALWHYKRGAARMMLGRAQDASADLRAAIGPDAEGWVRGRAHLELAGLARRQGDAAGAAREAGLAAAACEQAHDPVCVADARKMTSR